VREVLDLFKRLRVKVQNLVLRAVVDRPGARYQVLHIGGRIHPDVEWFQGQGVYFAAGVGAEGILVCPSATSENAVLLAVGDRAALPPHIGLAAGEGGLHYQGTFKVFLDHNGKVQLGGGNTVGHAAADFVALAAKVDAAIANIRTYINAHTHPTTATIGSGPAVGAVLAPNSPLGDQAGVGAVNVKAT